MRRTTGRDRAGKHVGQTTSASLSVVRGHPQTHGAALDTLLSAATMAIWYARAHNPARPISRIGAAICPRPCTTRIVSHKHRASNDLAGVDLLVVSDWDGTFGTFSCGAADSDGRLCDVGANMTEDELALVEQPRQHSQRF